MKLVSTVITTTLLAALAGCPSHHDVERPYPTPTVDTVLGKLRERAAAATSFRAESVMDYWLGDDRVKGTMKVMGTRGAKVRFNALSPAGDSVMADMACNGADFALVDMQNNCQLTGPCNADSIAQLLRVRLAPDDFFDLAIGNAPVLDGATGTLAWDPKHGREILTLTSAAGTQVLQLDGTKGRWDVMASERKDPDGTVQWSVENTDFEELTTDDGKTFRVPGKTRFKSPGEKADLLVEWGERVLNVPIEERRFALVPPAGLARCK